MRRAPNKTVERTADSLVSSRSACNLIVMSSRAAAHLLRSPMRAERAKPNSCKDDEILAQGKRSAALGYRRRKISSFLPSGLARQGRASPEGRKEVGLGGFLPRAAASAALPWAIILLPLRGAGKASQRAGDDNGGISAEFRAGRLWPAAPHHGRWPPTGGMNT